MPSEPQTGGCWICGGGDGPNDDNMVFDIEFDTYYHPHCLPDGVETLLEYERRTNDSGATIVHGDEQ